MGARSLTSYDDNAITLTQPDIALTPTTDSIIGFGLN